MFGGQSIRRKVTLVIFTACLVSLILSTGGMAAFELAMFRRRAVNVLRERADMIAASVYGAIDFRQPRVAAEVLATLASSRDIVEARLFTLQGEPFASYLRPPQTAVPVPALGADGPRSEAGHLALLQTLSREGAPFARLYLRSDLSGAWRQFVRTMGVIGALLIATMGIAAALSWLLQRALTRPVTELAAVVRAVTERKDYGLRAVRTADDEIGRLADSFNDMLTTVQMQNSALKDKEEFLNLLIESAGDAILLYDPDGRIVRVNEQACVSLGYSGATMRTLHRRDIEPAVSGPEDVRRQVAALARGGHMTVEGTFRRADGSTFPAEIRLSRMDAPSGAFVIAFARDVSERHRLEEQLRQSQKLEAIGQLAGGIAHDFNNIMTVIMGHASILRDDAMPGSENAEALDDVLNASRRAASLTRQLLAYSRRQIMRAEPLDLNEVVRDAVRMLTRLIGEHIRVVCRHDESLPRLRADGGMLSQVLINLAVNARDAMPQGGTLTISTSMEEVTSGTAAANLESWVGVFACITVSDTGCGMDSDTKKHIFEPFFTTKEVGQGTGLGLASVYGIVKQHDGWIDVISEPGHGSMFKVYLPIARAAPAREPAGAGPEPAKGGSESILLVEDEPPVRKLAREVLRRSGYRVFEAATGLQALALWRDRRGDFDLLLTDVVMPEGISGLELARRTRAEKPSLPVICCSGYSEELRQPEGAGDILFLPKPYTSADLLRAVRRCIDGGNGSIPAPPAAPSA